MKVARVFIVSYVRRTGSIGLLRVMKPAVHGYGRGLWNAGAVSELAVRVLAPTLELPARGEGAHVLLSHVNGNDAGDRGRLQREVGADKSRRCTDRRNARVVRRRVAELAARVPTPAINVAGRRDAAGVGEDRVGAAGAQDRERQPGSRRRWREASRRGAVAQLPGVVRAPADGRSRRRNSAFVNRARGDRSERVRSADLLW